MKRSEGASKHALEIIDFKTNLTNYKKLRKTTSMSAATANKFVNKAEVISAKSERAKKHMLEMIDVRNNRTNS